MRYFMNRRLHGLDPSGIRRFTRLAKAVPDCAMLTIGEPNADTPDPIKEACVQALANNRTHYPMNNGDPDLRSAVSAFEARRRGCSYGPGEIIMTAGATESIFVAMQGCLNPGDEVIIPMPAFGLYESNVRMAGAKAVYLDTSQDNFQISKEKLRAAITDKTRMLIVNSPNNPTGVVYTQETLEGIRDLVAGRPIFVLCDDVFDRMVYEPSPTLRQFGGIRRQMIICQSFSKPYAMTGWRLGYLMADSPVAEQLSLLHATTVSSIPAPFHDACIAALQQDVSPMVRTYQARRDYIYNRLVGMGLDVVKPTGSFYIFPSIKKFGMDDETFCTRMIREGKVAGVPGSCFGAEGYVRFSYCYSMYAIERGMDRLSRFIRHL